VTAYSPSLPEILRIQQQQIQLLLEQQKALQEELQRQAVSNQEDSPLSTPSASHTSVEMPFEAGPPSSDPFASRNLTNNPDDRPLTARELRRETMGLLERQDQSGLHRLVEFLDHRAEDAERSSMLRQKTCLASWN
jgi:hypothetical protein